MRLDQYLVQHLGIESRTKAQRLIVSGGVECDGVIVMKSSYDTSETTHIRLLPSKELRYVSIGGLKLEKALRHFQLDLTHAHVLDIGASTGGFTDCALQHGAAFVCAVDIGHGQLHPSLQQHPNILSLEGCDIRTCTLPDITFDCIVVDVSFIRLEHILPVLKKNSQKETKIILLVKPQFEQTTPTFHKGGIIKEERLRLSILQSVLQQLSLQGFTCQGYTPTDADGKEKNIEYLLYVTLQ